jgi:hypothetical protein
MTSTPDRGPVHVISDGSSEGPEDPGHELVMGSDDRCSPSEISSGKKFPKEPVPENSALVGSPVSGFKFSQEEPLARDRACQKKERAKNGLNHPNSEIHRGAHLVREPS